MRLGLGLVKVRISAAATLSALAVFVLASHGLSLRALPLGLGIFLLACGACALNQYQERGPDALMERTRGRPLPSGAVSPGQALAAAAILLAAGLLLVFRAAGSSGAVLAAAAVVWYDGVYTRLKRLTAFAVVPGALVGAVPPALGWLAAGRSWQDPKLLALCFFFYLWQVPHFWLLVPAHAADLGRAGFPNLGPLLGRVRLARLTAVWMSFVAASALLLPVFRAVDSTAAVALLAAAAGCLTWQAARLLRSSGTADVFPPAFIGLNVFVLAVMVVIASDPFLAGRFF